MKASSSMAIPPVSTDHKFRSAYSLVEVVTFQQWIFTSNIYLQWRQRYSTSILLWKTAVSNPKCFNSLHSFSTYLAQVALVVNNPLANTGDRSLGGEDPLEKEKATHSSILAWRVLWTEEPRWATVRGVCRDRHN